MSSLVLPRSQFIQTLEKLGGTFEQLPAVHDERRSFPFATCRAAYRTYFFMHMTCPQAIKAFNKTDKKDVPEYTPEELELAWTRTKEIFDSVKDFDQLKAWEDLVQRVPNLSVESIKAMLRANHPIRGLVQNPEHVKIAVWGHIHPQLMTGRTITGMLSPNGLLNKDSLVLDPDSDRDTAIHHLAGREPQYYSEVATAGLDMFRELVLSGTWNIFDEKMYGRPELALFLYKASSYNFAQCLIEEDVMRTRRTLAAALPYLPQNLRDDVKTDLFDYFEFDPERAEEYVQEFEAACQAAREKAAAQEQDC